MKIDVSESDLKTVLALLKKYLPSTIAWAFGSRVKFTTRSNSDLDLVAFIEPAQKIALSDLKDAFAESNLPFKVDIHSWDEIPDNFRKNIEREYMVLVDDKAAQEPLPEGWKRYKLEEVAEINPKVTLKQGNEYSFVEMRDLDPTLKYVRPSARRILKGGAKFRNGDTLFARITPCLENGKICQVKGLDNGVGFGSTEFIVFRGKEKSSDTDFIYYLTRTDYVRSNAILAMTGTSGRQRVEKSALEELEVIIPGLSTQKDIATILSSLDDKIELNRQMNQTLETMALAIFKEWFVDFNFPGFDGELVNGLPKGWRRNRLGEEFIITMGQSPPGESYNEAGEGILFYQGRTDFGLRFPRNRMYTTAPSRTAKKFDTLVSVRAPVGDINMAAEPCCIGRGLSAVRHNSSAYSYTYYSIKHLEHIFKGFESEGTVFGSINKTNFENIEAVVPEKQLIKRFETYINPMDEKILNNFLETRALTQIRDTLLPRLMTGKILVKV